MSAGIRLVGAAVLAGAGAAFAQGLGDPTRPPLAGDAADAAANAANAAPATRLHSILLSRGRKLAVIDGQMVPLGGMIGDAKLVRISESEVALRRGEETEVLRLLPAVGKKLVRSGSPATRERRDAR